MVDCVRVTHPCAAVLSVQAPTFSLDLHVLSLPLAFILSQDQTLHSNVLLLCRSITVLLEQTDKELNAVFKIVRASSSQATVLHSAIRIITAFEPRLPLMSKIVASSYFPQRETPPNLNRMLRGATGIRPDFVSSTSTPKSSRFKSCFSA